MPLRFAIVVTASWLCAHAAETSIADEVKAGAAMSASEAAKLETRLDTSGAVKVGEVARMLSWYAGQVDSPQARVIREKRIPLIVALIRGAGTRFPFAELGCVANLYRTGDAFATPTGYQLAKITWEQRLEDTELRGLAVYAAEFYFYEDAGYAINYALSEGNVRKASELMARALLGLGRLSYAGCEPVSFNAAAHESTLGKSIASEVEKTDNSYFLLNFGAALLRLGAALRSDWKPAWDYRAFARAAIEKGAKSLPEEAPCADGRPVLDHPKDEPKSLDRTQPKYPPSTRRRGKVAFDVVIGCTGKVLWAEYVDGVEELLRPAREALMQWRYEPRQLNGQPVWAVVRAEVSFTR